MFTPPFAPQAQYFKDPLRLDAYKQYNTFLADINNEDTTFDPTYAPTIAQMELIALYKFSEDTMVEPPESGWFSDLSEGGAGLIPLRETELYKQDWIGLRALDEKGGLVFRELAGQHLSFDVDQFIDIV